MMKMIFLRRLLLVAVLGAVAVLSQACDSSEAEGGADASVVPPSTGSDVVVLDRCLAENGMYFGNFWEEGYGNYYFELASGEVGWVSEIATAPMNPGDYIVSFDLWGALSEDHTRPIVPEGVYTASEERADGTFILSHTLAIYNSEQVGEQVRIEEIRFTDGTVTVKHVAEGYDIRAHFETAAGQTYDFSYVGAVEMTDWSDDEKETWEIGHDVTMAPIAVTKAKWEDPEGDNYYIRCFDAEISDDGLHCATTGTKLQISLYVEQGADLVGTFPVGSNKVPGEVVPGERWAMEAYGSYCEQILPNLKVKYCVIKGGSVTIAHNEDDTYTFDVDFTTADGYAVTGHWTLPIEEFVVRESPQTTLTEDVVFDAQQCSEIRYFGDAYDTETSNYTLFLDSADGSERLGLDLCAPKDDGTHFPTGTFTVATTCEAFTLIPGNIGSETADLSCYIRYAPTGDAVAAAPIVGGTLTVTEDEEGVYTFEYELYDDYNRADETLQPHRISGSWSGTLPEIIQGSEGLTVQAAGRRQAKQLGRTR